MTSVKITFGLSRVFSFSLMFLVRDFSFLNCCFNLPFVIMMVMLLMLLMMTLLLMLLM